jgi:hypothetical protein
VTAKKDEDHLWACLARSTPVLQDLHLQFLSPCVMAHLLREGPARPLASLTRLKFTAKLDFEGEFQEVGWLPTGAAMTNDWSMARWQIVLHGRNLVKDARHLKAVARDRELEIALGCLSKEKAVWQECTERQLEGLVLARDLIFSPDTSERNKWIGVRNCAGK